MPVHKRKFEQFYTKNDVNDKNEKISTTNNSQKAVSLTIRDIIDLLGINEDIKDILNKTVDKDGYTALTYTSAQSLEGYKYLDRLAARGADPNLMDAKGRTPVLAVIKGQSLPNVSTLLDVDETELETTEVMDADTGAPLNETVETPAKEVEKAGYSPNMRKFFSNENLKKIEAERAKRRKTKEGDVFQNNDVPRNQFSKG